MNLSFIMHHYKIINYEYNCSLLQILYYYYYCYWHKLNSLSTFSSKILTRGTKILPRHITFSAASPVVNMEAYKEPIYTIILYLTSDSYMRVWMMHNSNILSFNQKSISMYNSFDWFLLFQICNYIDPLEN